MVKSLSEIKELKQQWEADPTWDIEATEGFEAHFDYLINYRLNKEAEWSKLRDKNLYTEHERIHNSSTLDGRIKAYKRRYKREIESLAAMLPHEIEHMQDNCYEPSSAIESTLLNVVRYGNCLKVLLEVEE